MIAVRRLTLLITLAIGTLMVPSPSSAAIPCGDLPVIRPPRDIVIPAIAIELPVSLGDVLGSGPEADRTNATTADEEQASLVEMAAMNQFRCLGYGNSVTFMGNATPEYRVHTTAISNVEDDVEYIAVNTVHVVQFRDAFRLGDDRSLVDFRAIIDDETFMDGEMVFVEHDGGPYLNSSFLRTGMALGAKHDVKISDPPSRQPGLVRVANGDVVTFTNTSEESSASITITDPSGATIFDGFAGGTGLTGGENGNVFVAYNLEPGDYTVTISLYPSDVETTVTLQVAD